MVDIVVDNRIRIRGTDLLPGVAQDLCSRFRYTNPAFIVKQRMGIPTYDEPREIKTWREVVELDNRWLTFPRGGLAKVRQCFDTHGVERKIIDKRITGAIGEDRIPKHKVKLYEYQETLAQKAIDAENCILRAPTGSGKTTVGFAIASRVGVSTLVVVSTRGLFDQWMSRAGKELGIDSDDVGEIRAGVIKLRPLTIAIQKSLANIASRDLLVREYFGCVICDEVQQFAAKTFFDAVDPFPAKWRIGISADHTRKDKKEFLTADLFGVVAADVPRRTLIESGHVMDVDVCVIPTDFSADWYGLPGKSDPFNQDPHDEEKELDHDRLLKEMAADENRRALILDVITSEVSRGEQVLVMTHQRDFCRALDQQLVARGVKTGFLIGGEDYRKEFERTRAAFEKGDVRVAVGTFQAIGQAIDLPRASVVVCATPIASNRQVVNQVRGRVCRVAKGKDHARLYYLWDKEVAFHGDKHLKNLVSWNDGNVIVRRSGKWVSADDYLRGRR